MKPCAAMFIALSVALSGNAVADQGTPATGAPAKATGAPGQIWVVLRDATCKEVGPDASDQPWKLKKGSFVTWLASEGSMTRVETAPGMTPCLIASDAIGPTSGR